MAGHALHDTDTETGSFFQRTIGGISGSLLWSVLIILIIYLLYLKLTNHCLSPFKNPSPHTRHQLLKLPLFLQKLPRSNTLHLLLINPRLLNKNDSLSDFQKSKTRLQLRMYELYVPIIVTRHGYLVNSYSFVNWKSPTGIFLL